MIIDDVRASLPNSAVEPFDKMMKTAVIVKAHNVSNYYYENEQDYWAPADFPNVAPPWQNVWIEWNIPRSWNTDQVDKIPEHLKYEQITEKLWRVHAPMNDYAACHILYEEPEWTKQIDIRWIAHCSYYRGNLPGSKYLMTQKFFVTPTGQFKPMRSEDKKSVEIILKNLGMDWERPDDPHREFVVPTTLSQEAYEARQMGLFKPDTSAYDVAFLTLSFCNCKNVLAVKEMIDEPVRKKRAANNKLNITRTYTLNIQPIKTILRQEGKTHNVTGVQKALHICRGRFRDYTEGHGLFGKWHGLYYWHDLMRGTAVKGTVKKDYNVEAPDDNK